MDGHVWILGAPIQLMGCFEIYSSPYWVTDLIMPLYHFIFLVVTCFFVS